jgi:hypothetical protein
MKMETVFLEARSAIPTFGYDCKVIYVTKQSWTVFFIQQIQLSGHVGNANFCAWINIPAALDIHAIFQHLLHPALR